MNPETMNVASMMASIRKSRLLADANAPRATTTQAMVNSNPKRVTCCRMPGASGEWKRDHRCITFTMPQRGAWRRVVGGRW